MIRIRRAGDRGRVNMGWLDSRHTFSFGHYFDPEHTGFGNLRVINEDRVKPGKGFGTHAHRDMEIVSYVIDGALEHRDSMGNGSVLRPGDVQRMSAGTGVEHSEFNHSHEEPVHFLQIWILPEREALQPGYEEKRFERVDKLDRLRLIAAGDGRDGAVTLHQDADMYAGVLSAGTTVGHAFGDGRNGWLQVIRGNVTLGGERLGAGDGAAISEADSISLLADEETELLLFDLA